MISTIALTIVIHFTNLAGAPVSVVREAQGEVAAMLQEIGIAVEWADPSAPSATLGGEMRLTLLPYESGSLRQSVRPVLGAATRTELGTRIALVFYGRVVEESDRHGAPAVRVLACAMAHELGHLLQEMPGHERDGLMRDVWRQSDFRNAALGRLRFTKEAAPAAR